MRFQCWDRCYRAGCRRVFIRLIKDKEVALSASAGPDERRGPSLLVFNYGRPGFDLAALEKLIYEDIERLQNQEIADWELSKVKCSCGAMRPAALQHPGTG